MVSIIKRAYEAFECNYTCGLSLRKFLRVLSLVGMISSIVYIAVGTYIIVHIVQTEKVEWFPNAYYRIPLADGPVASRIVFRPPESYQNGGGTPEDFTNFQQRQRQDDPYPFIPFQQPRPNPAPVFPALEDGDDGNVRLGKQQEQDEQDDRAIYYRRNVGLFICLAATLILMNFIQLIVDIALFFATLKSKKSQFWVYFLLNIILWIMTLCCFITIFSGGGIFLLLVFLFGTAIRVYIVYILHELMSDIGKPRAWSGTNQIEPAKEVLPEPRAIADPEMGNAENVEASETETRVTECNENDDGGTALNDASNHEQDGDEVEDAGTSAPATSSTKALQTEAAQDEDEEDADIEKTEVEILQVEKSDLQMLSAAMKNEEECDVIVIEAEPELKEIEEEVLGDDKKIEEDAEEPNIEGDVESGNEEKANNDTVIVIEAEELEEEPVSENEPGLIMDEANNVDISDAPQDEETEVEEQAEEEVKTVNDSVNENEGEKHDIGTETVDTTEHADNATGEDNGIEDESEATEIKCVETQTSDVEDNAADAVENMNEDETEPSEDIKSAETQTSDVEETNTKEEENDDDVVDEAETIKSIETQTSDAEEEASNEIENNNTDEANEDDNESETELKSVEVQTFQPVIGNDTKPEAEEYDDDDIDDDIRDSISLKAERLVDEIVMNCIETQTETISNDHEHENVDGESDKDEEETSAQELSPETAESDADREQMDDDGKNLSENGMDLDGPNDDDDKEEEEKSVGLYDIATEDIAEPPGLYEIATEDELCMEELEEDTQKTSTLHPAPAGEEGKEIDTSLEKTDADAINADGGRVSQDDEVHHSKTNAQSEDEKPVELTPTAEPDADPEPVDDSAEENKSSEDSQETKSEEDNLAEGTEITTNELNNNNNDGIPVKKKRRSRRGRRPRKIQ